MFHTHSREWVWNILLLRSKEAALNVDHLFSLPYCLRRCSWWRQKLLFHFLSMKFCSQNVCWLLCCCGSPRACKHFCVCVCVINTFLNKIHVLFCCFSSIFHPLTFVSCESSIPSYPCWLSCHFCGIVPDVTLIWFPVCVVCVNGWCYCLNDIFSLVPPSGESISPSHSQSFVPHVQIEKVNHAKDSEGGDQSASIPCIEIHAVGLRRCSEPLSYIPQHHQTKPPVETETRLAITSEQRSLICFPQNHKFSPNQIKSKRCFFRSV